MNYSIIKTRRQIKYGSDQFDIPIGLLHYFSRPEYKNSKVSQKDGIFYIETKKQHFVLHPPFEKEIVIQDKNYDIFIVTKDQDKIYCQSIILHEHYLQPPNRGMFIACRDKENSKIVACCIIDELTYGNPKSRSIISHALTQKNDWTIENWAEQNRSAVRKELNVCWLSRIAVLNEKKYRGKGIATKMLEMIPNILAKYHPVKPHYLEVIATYAKEGTNSFEKEKNIFCRANYHHNLLSSYTHREINPNTGNFEPKPGNRYYFWIEIPYERLFVPLASEPFNWFLSGQKKWELRKADRQYTKKYVYKGRMVELRKGYNTDEKLFGQVDNVVESVSLEGIFEKASFKEIIPIAKNKSEAISISLEILKPSKLHSFIAFKIDLNDTKETI